MPAKSTQRVWYIAQTMQFNHMLFFQSCFLWLTCVFFNWSCRLGNKRYHFKNSCVSFFFQQISPLPGFGTPKMFFYCDEIGVLFLDPKQEAPFYTLFNLTPVRWVGVFFLLFHLLLPNFPQPVSKVMTSRSETGARDGRRQEAVRGIDYHTRSRYVVISWLLPNSVNEHTTVCSASSSHWEPQCVALHQCHKCAFAAVNLCFHAPVIFCWTFSV